MNVEGFKGAFSDLARPNRFEVSLGRAGNMEFFCKATEVPPLSVEAMDVPYQGRIIKLPGDRTNPDWTATVYTSEDYAIYKALKQWNEQINQPQGNVSAPPAAVKEDAIVRQLNRFGSPIQTWTLVGCFPTEVGSVSFDWSNNSTPGEFTVTFAFDYVQEG